MSNIHTIDEYRDHEDNAREDTPFNRSFREAESSFVQRSKPVDLLNLIFPNFTWKSFVIAISFIQLVMYIVTVSIKPREILTPSDSILISFGANVTSKIKEGQVHRLIMPIFLHANLFHIFFNLLFQLRMGFTLEKNYGILRIALLYFITGIYGNLLSASITYCSVKVGASTSGMGLMGIVAAELCLLWHIIRHRERVIFNILFYSMISFFYYFTLNWANIDHVGHLGGFLAGLCLGFLYNEKISHRPSWYKYSVIGSYITLIALAAAPTAVLFSVNRTCSVE